VWNVSLHGPITSGNAIAKTPSAEMTAAISTEELVKRPNSGGRYAATIEIEKASPKAPNPSDQTRPGFRLGTGGRRNNARRL
jgi:hypothetical protein